MQSSNVADANTRVLRRVLKDTPIIFNVQDIFPENAAYCGSISRSGMVYKILSSMQRRAYRRVDKIITISEDMKAQLCELGVPSDKVEVVYNWSYRDTPYDLSELDYSRVAPLFDKDKFNVVYAGNIGMMQNVELVVRAAAKLSEHTDIAFHIFGDGLYKNKLTALAEELGAGNLTFHKMLDSADAPALYGSADLNVIPLGENIYRTALPSKTATCLATGKPVALCIGKESEFGRRISESFGVALLGANDADELAKAVLAAREDRDSRLNTADFEKYFSLTANSGRYGEIIIDLV
jgi:glycosyltransferase involved in cell wall biosynthesis